MVPDFSVFVSLLNNISIFIVLIAGYAYFSTYLSKKIDPRLRDALLGVFFGVITIGAMHIFIPIAEGVRVDQRNAIITLAGAFGGPVTAIVCAVFAGTYRVYLGGAGALAGVVAAFLAASVGIFLYRMRDGNDSALKIAFGSILAVIVIIPSFLVIVDLETGWSILKRMFVPWGSAMFVGLFFGGLMLAREDLRLKVENEITRSEARFKNLFESSEISIWNADLLAAVRELKRLRKQGVKDFRQHVQENHHLVADLARMISVNNVNPASLTLFKFSSENELISSIGKLFSPDFHEFCLNVFCAIWDGEKHYRTETLMRASDGEELTVIIFLPLSDTEELVQNTPVGILDISDRKLAEQSRDLALQDAERANEAKSQFLATMSHELRTPLNAILGFSDIISKQYFGPADEGGRYVEYAKDIHFSGELLLELVNDLLDISTIEAGRKSLTLAQVEIEDLISESLRIVEQKAENNGIDLLTDIPPHIPPLYADRRALLQVLLNLLSNAIKFTPEGGTVTVRVNVNLPETEVIIHDTGRGIPAENLQEVMNPFVRTESDPHKTQEGWGLGLAIAKSLIELHDGKLELESKVGEGTAVRIRFPAPASRH